MSDDATTGIDSRTPSMRRDLAIRALIVALAVAILGTQSTFGQDGGPAAHPDFSGLWFPAGFPRIPRPLPLTDAAQPLAARYEKEFAIDDDAGRYCIWPGMPRSVWGAPFPIEIIQRPQDVTIYWEGYGMYRKIYMADHHPPPSVLPSAMGHSVGRWEGDTLVIETTDLRAYPYMRSLPTTSAAKLLERMRIDVRTGEKGARKYLVDDITLTDPKMYKIPIQIKAEAELRSDVQLLEYTCTDTLWDDYLQSRGLTLPDVDALPEPGRVER